MPCKTQVFKSGEGNPRCAVPASALCVKPKKTVVAADAAREFMG